MSRILMPDLTAEQVPWHCVQYPPCRWIGTLATREAHLAAAHKGEKAAKR